MTPRVRYLALALLVAATGSCEDNEPAQLPPNVRHWISRVQLTAVGVGAEPVVFPEPIEAVFDPNEPPPESQGPFIAMSPVYQDAGAGTSLPYDFTTYARNHLAAFYVWVGEGTGFWRVTLPEPPGSMAYGVGMKVTITFSPTAPTGSFHLRTTGTDTLGNTGAIADQRVVMFVPDTGEQVPDVSASLAWAGGADLDVHVIDPFGHDLSVFSPSTPEGGVLRPEGDGVCAAAATNSERAWWPKGTAPAGEYRVIVTYYADCGLTAPVPFSLTLGVKGREDQVFSRQFDGPAAGSKPDTVATFTVR